MLRCLAYLDGKIDPFWFRQDQPGVVFPMNGPVDEAQAALDALALAAGGFMGFALTPVGPLAPLAMLLEGK